MELMQLIETLDNEIVTRYNQYSELMKKFDAYRGLVLTPQNVEEINVILKDIQDIWVDLHKIFYFIGQRHPLAAQASQEHFNFIEGIKKVAGMEKTEGQS